MKTDKEILNYLTERKERYLYRIRAKKKKNEDTVREDEIINFIDDLIAFINI